MNPRSGLLCRMDLDESSGSFWIMEIGDRHSVAAGQWWHEIGQSIVGEAV
jgi:hypothetical protein